MLRSLAAYGVCARALSMTVDSHLHCWSSKFPYAEGKAPPATLGDEVASAEALLKMMDAQGVAQALIVQPINYLYDHTYVASVVAKYPTRFRGMLLANPT